MEANANQSAISQRKQVMRDRKDEGIDKIEDNSLTDRKELDWLN